MSRRTATVEDFDDDTELDLPSFPLPNTGSKGPLLQEMHIDEDRFPSASTPRQQPQQRPSGTRKNNTVSDITPYKTWSCIYPIYIDAKRPYGTGERRVERAKSVWWPLSTDIADATNRLGLGTLHEISKSHPRDWDNPGRVRVQWKKDGRLVNPNIKTKKQLLEMISIQIQHLKPENAPKPPYNNVAPPVESISTTPPVAPPNSKGKQTPSTKSKAAQAAPSTVSTPLPSQKQPSGHLPAYPPTSPPLAARVSPYSPALPSGVLVETVKAGLNAQQQQDASTPAIAAPTGQAQPGAGVGKGKRKVVRVRG